MNKIFICCLFATVVFSCKKKDEPEPGNPCVGGVETPVFITSCDNFPDTKYFCSIEFVGKFQLEESSKAYQPQYCEPIGKSIRYRNEKGETIELKIDDKTYQKSNAIYSAAFPCPGDSTKTVGYCIDFERLQVGLREQTDKLDLTISVETKPDMRNPGPGRAGDFLVITRTKNNILYSDANFVLNKRTLSYEEDFNQVHLNQVELLGKTYTDVLTNDITFFANPKPYKYYFNKGTGLIGFVDSDGVLWVIEE